MQVPRLVSVCVGVLGIACAGDLPARTPPSLSSAEMIPESDLEARVARIGYEASKDRIGERSRWIELELRHAEDRPVIAALWLRYERADLVFTALQQLQARTPTSERNTLEVRVGDGGAARVRLQVWVRRALASSEEWYETRGELEAALLSFEKAVGAR